jgi:asparagine synthase (glutamine-hydrolysing)
MCGIAGIVNFSIDELDQEVVQKMMDVLHHRGPDGEGIFRDHHVVLGHVRLSIIDIEGSRQPLSNEDGTVWVIFNGEIYNYRELRVRLAGLGHQFRTKGDTETLVHLYEQYGNEMVHHLLGMFAFVIWDTKKQVLLAFRDRLGIKPFYFCRRGDNFIFASEPKALFQHPDIQARPSVEGIWHYLTYRSVPAPGTLFEGIRKLKPGWMIQVDRAGWQEKCYWDIPLNTEPSSVLYGMRESGNAIEEVETLLLRSVKRRLISDVPLGAFLSGGVDSGLIVAMMSKLTNAPVHTYSVGFKDFPTSELPFAKEVANLYNTDHHELVLEPECFAENLEKLTWMRDSPLSERGDIPLYLLAKMASRDVKVLLSGEGSDELFAGYPKYAFDRFASLACWAPKPLVQRINRMLPANFRRVEVALKSLCEKHPDNRWAMWFSPFTEEEKLSLMLSENTWPNPTAEYAARAKGCTPLDAMLYVDCKLWLPDNLLERGDRMTMAASVEGRVPFLDHELVEYAFRLPRRFKIRAMSRKWIIKQVARQYLPNSIIYRPKNGFDVPLAQWFRGKLKDMCYDRICNRNGLLSQILRRQELEKILDDHCAYRKDNFLKIWTLLGLSIWDNLFCSA